MDTKAAVSSRGFNQTRYHRCISIKHLARKAPFAGLNWVVLKGGVAMAAASQCGVAKASAKCQSGVKDSDTGPWSRGGVERCSME